MLYVKFPIITLIYCFVLVVLTIIKNNKKLNDMDIINEALEFENAKMSHMSTSDRVEASREGKRLVLALNEIYKKTKDSELMEIMKRVTAKKQKIEVRLKGRVQAT